MKYARTHAILYGKGEDDKQVVQIEYTYEKRNGWYEPTEFEIQEVIILTPLVITPSDVKTDIEEAIAEDLGVGSWRIFVQCEVEERAECEMMFIGGGEPVPVFAYGT